MSESADLLLLDAVRTTLVARRYSPNTIRAYLSWVRRFVLFSQLRGRGPLRRLTSAEVERFLVSLVEDEHVSVSTERQATAALVFLLTKVLGQKLRALSKPVPTRSTGRFPAILSAEEAAALLSHLEGQPRMMAALLYGSGLRLMECCRLKIKDIDLTRQEVTLIREKGHKRRVVPLPRELLGDLAWHLAKVRHQHQRDWEQGAEWVFPATRTSLDRCTGKRRRHHMHHTVLQKAVARAALITGLNERATCRSLRHSAKVR